MTNKQIDEIYEAEYERWEERNKCGPAIWHAFARALLARQPAAIDKEAVCRVCNGHGYRTAMSATGEGAFNETCVYCKGTGKATPLAKEASKPAVRNCQTGWADFCLMAKHDGVTCPRESCDIDDGIRAAPSVEQDERAAFDQAFQLVFEAYSAPRDHWKTDDGYILHLRGKVTKAFSLLQRVRAASTSANVAQLDMSLEARLADAEADVKRLHAEKMELWNQVHGYSVNVAHGAEAVATVKVYETYTGQNGWIEVTQEEYDRAKDKYEHRIRRVPAPPAQTAITDEQIVALTKQVTGWTTHFAIPQEPHGHFYAGHHHKASVDEILRLARAALTAAQSASGDTK